MSELKPCPFCGGTLRLDEEEIYYPGGHNLGLYFAVCNGDGLLGGNCPMTNPCNADEQGGVGASYPKDEAIKITNSRPIEDALLARAEKAEDIIHGMFPLWVAAMSYAEHGRAADLDRIRNYYNGRNNPLTSEQLYYLFSMEDKK